MFAILVLWLSQIPNLSVASDTMTDEIVKVSFRMTMYAIFFILVYRSFILTLKSTVLRLSKWRSKREQEEDKEFVFIIETLVLIATIFITICFSFFEEYSQIMIMGRNNSNPVVACSIANLQTGILENSSCFQASSLSEANKDVLVSIMSILLTAIIVYSLPIIGELEVAIKYKLVNVVKRLKKDNNNNT